MSWANLFVSLALLAALSNRPANSQCAAAPEIKKVTDAYTATAGNHTAPIADQKAAQKRILDEALAANPTDYFLLDRQRDWFDDNSSAGREAAISYFAALHERYPQNPAVTDVYADALRARDGAQALKLLEDSEKAHPDDPWAHFKLISVFEFGRFQSDPRLLEEIDSYSKLCTPGAFIYRVLLSHAPPDQIARHAALLRARLEAASGNPNQNLWGVLWDMEFRAAPPTEHAAVRERIAKDLARFEALPNQNRAAWLTFLRQGYALIGDKAAADRIDARLTESFPNSEQAEHAITSTWQDQHPFPPRDASHAAMQAWYHESGAAAHDWYQRWHNVLYMMEEFTARAELDDSKPEDLLAFAREYVKVYQGNPSFYGSGAVEFDVAGALINKKLLPPEIPAWVDEGLRRESNRPSRLTGSSRDDLSPELKKEGDNQIAYMRIARARVLLDYYDALGQPSKASGIEDQIAGIIPSDWAKPELYEVRAHAAAMQNRKLDALLFYRAARDLGGRQSGRGKTDAEDLDQKIEQLYKDLGGTPATLALFTGKTKIEPLSTMQWAAPKNPLPAFSLADLAGKTWKLADLNGKPAFINIWATWCGPCREEHPALQKLYEEFKSGKEFTLLSINVDEKAGLVAPYMAEHAYTFPVLLGTDIVKAVNGPDGFGIPQNWFLTPAGKLETIQQGYGGDPTWPSTIISKLKELTRK